MGTPERLKRLSGVLQNGTLAAKNVLCRFWKYGFILWFSVFIGIVSVFEIFLEGSIIVLPKEIRKMTIFGEKGTIVRPETLGKSRLLVSSYLSFKKLGQPDYGEWINRRISSTNAFSLFETGYKSDRFTQGNDDFTDFW